MKRNVDLTANRFFSSTNFFGDTGILTIGMITGEKFPWNAYAVIYTSDDDMDMEHQRRAIIAVGDKATRAKVKEYRHMDSLDYCDCCGIRMNLKPWDREIGVCHKCNSYYMSQDDKCKWRNRIKIMA